MVNLAAGWCVVISVRARASESGSGRPTRKGVPAVLVAIAVLVVLATGCSAPAKAELSGFGGVTSSVPDSSTAAVTTTAPTTTVATPPTTAASPHFATPQAAMIYLASAWNRDDVTELDHVTNPAARAALQSMRSEAVNLRLDHCTPRPQGDYVCFFSHDYPPGTRTTVPGGVGQAVFLVGPAARPGWYMTVLQQCG